MRMYWPEKSDIDRSNVDVYITFSEVDKPSYELNIKDNTGICFIIIECVHLFLCPFARVSFDLINSAVVPLLSGVIDRYFI